MSRVEALCLLALILAPFVGLYLTALAMRGQPTGDAPNE